MRPSDEGRNRVCSWSRDDGKIVQWTKGTFNARTRVHEYGGGSFFVHSGIYKDTGFIYNAKSCDLCYYFSLGVLYFSNFDDQVLYKQTTSNADPIPLTPAGKGRKDYLTSYFLVEQAFLRLALRRRGVRERARFLRARRPRGK